MITCCENFIWALNIKKLNGIENEIIKFIEKQLSKVALEIKLKWVETVKYWRIKINDISLPLKTSKKDYTRILYRAV